MPARPLLAELRSPTAFICRRCLARPRIYSFRSSQSRLPETESVALISTATARAASTERRRRGSRRPTRSQQGQNDGEATLYQEKLRQLQDAIAQPPAEDNDFSIRFLEQEADNQVKTEESSLKRELGQLDGLQIKHALGAMQGQIKSADERAALQGVLSDMGVDLGQLSSSRDFHALAKRLEGYEASIDAQIKDISAEFSDGMNEELGDMLPDMKTTDILPKSTPAPGIPEKPWTPNQRKKIARLNSAIAKAYRERQREDEVGKKTILLVYKAYHAARLALAQRWATVPIDVWDLLWDVFAADDTANTNRLASVSLLSRDMSEAGVTLSPPQQLLTIEAVFLDGWEARALDSWKRSRTTLGNQSAETFQDFWRLGVRMFCRLGDVEQAERAASRLLQDEHLDARILMPLIQTCSEKDAPELQDKAWSMYRQMRELLAQDMKLADYDQVISYFLANHQVENALYAFVDMMSDGQIDLKKQKFMPSVVANRFFLGKWLKRLIGAGDLDGSYAVIDFMRRKGVEAASIHLNGLIGAWQRSGGTDDVRKAENLGWEMIASRIDFVKTRKRRREERQQRSDDGVAKNVSLLTEEQQPHERQDSEEHHHDEGRVPMPRATLETFSLLAENYRQRGLHAQLSELWDAFRDAEISPNAFMMNQLLESFIQDGQHSAALELYASLVTDRGICPNPYTFAALWKTLSTNRLYHHDSSSFVDSAASASARRLFAEMVRFRAVFAGEPLDLQLGRKILHTFRRLQDHAGLVMALAALRQIFGFLPPEALTLELILGTGKLSLESSVQRRRLMLAKRDLDKELLAWAGQGKNDDNGAGSDLEGTKRGEALYDFLQRTFWPKEIEKNAETTDVKAILEKASVEMGVSELDLQLSPPMQRKRK